jgi:PucR family transcriptional regulator, purine catabolism regulatory protein
VSKLRALLTVGDVAGLPGLGLAVVAGSDGLGQSIGWVHSSELADPTPWLEGGELLLTSGLGLGGSAASQRTYVRRLSRHGLAGLGIALGLSVPEVVPAAVVDEANRLDFPVLTVPFDTPFIAITKAVAAAVANEELNRVKQALEVHEALAGTVLEGRGVQALLATLCEAVDCSLQLVDDQGRVLGELHPADPISFDEALELPVVAHGERAILKVARDGREPSEYDRLVLHHGQTALAFELSRRRAISSAELRLAGDLLEDLEQDRLDEREVARRIAAFGLDPATSFAALLGAPAGEDGGETLRLAISQRLDDRGVRYLSAARTDRAAFLLEAEGEDVALELAEAVVEAEPAARVGVGRPGRGAGLGRSLLEARAALDAGVGRIASYRDLGSLELLLGLPDATLDAFVDRVLGAVQRKGPLVESLRTLLETGCRWSEAATTLGVHRHTLRYRMARLEEQTGLHPDRPGDRMELWLAVKAAQALAARNPARDGTP